MDLNNKIAIVTGGGSGIGFQFVRLLVEKNCSVVIGDLALTDEAQEYISSPSSTQQKGSTATLHFKKTDVTVWKELQDLFTFTEKEIGAPDVVCPAAGIFEPAWSNFWNDTEDQSYKTIQVNCEHPVKVTRLAIRSFLGSKKPGVILHVSSVGAQTPRLNTPIYCATKAFVSHFIRGFDALQETEKIRVVGVAPGLVSTPLWHDHNPEKKKNLSGKEDWIQPIDIAKEMINLVEDWSIGGGSVVEVTAKESTRMVELFNDPGPAFWKKSDKPVVEPEVLEWLEKERKTSML